MSMALVGQKTYALMVMVTSLLVIGEGINYYYSTHTTLYIKTTIKRRILENLVK